MRKENVSLLVLSAVYEILEIGRYTCTLITQRILHLSKMWTLSLDWNIRYKKYFLHCTLVFKKCLCLCMFLLTMYNVHFQTIFSYSKTYIFTVYLLIFVCFKSSEKGSYKSPLITRSLQSKHIMINWWYDVVRTHRKELFLRQYQLYIKI